MEQLVPPENGKLRELAPLIPEGLPLGLRNYWYPVRQSEDLGSDAPIGLTVLGEKLVMWRDAHGQPRTIQDRCPHRSIRLSAGRVLDGDLQCVLHGLRFDGSGRCTLIPWEEYEPEKQRDRLGVAAYPTAELGGYIWVYVGDAERFPPPPIESEVPEELLKADEFIWFRLPTEVWDGNWLLAVDGSDGFHAVTLHAGSQAVADGKWEGGAAAEAGIRFEDRRVKIVETSHGVRGVSVDLEGKPIHHGHFTVDVKGDRFTLPCIHTNPIVAAPGAKPYAARLWQFPIDETHTQVSRFISWRADTDEERERVTRIFHDIALPRLQRVSAEDAWAVAAQGDLVQARSKEVLLQADKDVIRVRRLIRDAFVRQARSGDRLPPRDGALAFPV